MWKHIAIFLVISTISLPKNYNLYPKKCNLYHNTYYFILICYTKAKRSVNHWMIEKVIEEGSWHGMKDKKGDSLASIITGMGGG